MCKPRRNGIFLPHLHRAKPKGYDCSGLANASEEAWSDTTDPSNQPQSISTTSAQLRFTAGASYPFGEKETSYPFGEKETAYPFGEKETAYPFSE